MPRLLCEFRYPVNRPGDHGVTGNRQRLVQMIPHCCVKLISEDILHTVLCFRHFVRSKLSILGNELAKSTGCSDRLIQHPVLCFIRSEAFHLKLFLHPPDQRIGLRSRYRFFGRNNFTYLSVTLCLLHGAGHTDLMTGQ